MVKDFELMLNIKPLYEKKIVIWGMGAFGKEYFHKFIQIGVKDENILLCDSNPQKYGQRYENHKVISPGELKNVIDNDYVIFIGSVFKEVQNDILRTIADLKLENIDAYSDYGIQWGLYLNQKDNEKRQQNQTIRCSERAKIENTYVELQRLKFFTFAPMYKEMILVYQPGKVGSMSIHESILEAGKYALHVHNLKEIEYSKGNIKKMAQAHSAKIISLVRDPIARAMSALWYGFRRSEPYYPLVENGGYEGFEGVHKKYFYEGFENQEFQWFNNEMKEVFGIDIYEYPFDKERGYSIIEQDHLQLMLLTTEKINDLEEEIGRFVGIDCFSLESKNIAEQSDYRFAYAEYKEKVRFSKSMLDRVYNNSYVKHFYTEEIIESFYRKWEAQIDDNCFDNNAIIKF